MNTTPLKLEQEHVVTLAAALAICNLAELERLVPDRSAVATKIVKVQDAIASIAALAGCKLDEYWINIGVESSNAGMKAIKKALLAEARRQKALESQKTAATKEPKP